LLEDKNPIFNTQRREDIYNNSNIQNNYFNYIFNDSNTDNYIVRENQDIYKILNNLNKTPLENFIKENETKIIKKELSSNNFFTKQNFKGDNKVINKDQLFRTNSQVKEINQNQMMSNSCLNYEDFSIKSTNYVNENKFYSNQISSKNIEEKSLKQIIIKNLRETNCSSDSNTNIEKDVIKKDNKNIEILRVYLKNVSGINREWNNSKENNLVFTVFKNENLFDSFKEFLESNNISEKFEFPILVNIFQSLTLIYNLTNSKISQNDEKIIKTLHNLWKNHCYLISQKSLSKKHKDIKNLEHTIDDDLNKLIHITPKENEFNLIRIKDLNNILFGKDFMNIESIDKIDYEEEFETSNSSDFSFEDEGIGYQRNIELLNKTF
jgi:hypothetical protein